MPDEPENPQNLPGRHRPRLTDLSKETTEEDLWDLEGDEMSAPADTPAPSNPQPVSGDSDEVPEEVPKKNPATAAKIPTEPRSKPRISPTKRSRKSSPPPPVVGDPDPVEPKVRNTPRSIDPSSRPLPPKAARPNGPRSLDPKSIDSPQAEIEAAPDTPKAEKVKPEKRDSEPSTPSADQDKSSLLGETSKKGTGSHEAIGLISLGVIFLGLAIWWIISLFSTISTTRLGDDQPDFPAEGKFITVDTAETYWRKPVRDGDRPDIARSDVEFIPVLNLSIEESNIGIIRVIFRNDQNEFVGDSISHSFANGVFEANAKATIEFSATDGFASSGEFNGYRVGKDRWTVEVYEGPSADASGSEFNLLFTAPVSSNRQ